MTSFNSSSVEFDPADNSDLRRYAIMKKAALLMEDISESFIGDSIHRLIKTKEYLDMCLAMIQPGLDNFLSPHLKSFQDSYEVVYYARWVLLPTIYKQELENLEQDGPEIMTKWN